MTTPSSTVRNYVPSVETIRQVTTLGGVSAIAVNVAGKAISAVANYFSGSSEGNPPPRPTTTPPTTAEENPPARPTTTPPTTAQENPPPRPTLPSTL